MLGVAKNSASAFLGGVGFWQESQEIAGIAGRRKRNPLVKGGVGSFFSSYLGEASLRRKRGGREGGNMLEHEAMSGAIIGSAVTVHRELGPGFLESVYEAALAYELGVQGTPFDRQVLFPILYRGTRVGRHRLRQRARQTG